MIILDKISKGCSMITSRAGSPIDDVVFLIGLALVVGSTYFFFKNREKKNENVHRDFLHHCWDSTYVGWS